MQQWMRQTLVTASLLVTLLRPGMALAGDWTSPLTVELDGVRYSVKARAVQAGRGWGVDVVVVAVSIDGAPHGIDDAPIRLSGSISRASGSGGGSGGGFGEGRSSCGSDWSLSLQPDVPLLFERSYPDNNGWDPVMEGETLELTVGLFAVEGTGGARSVPQLAVVVLDAQGPDEPHITLRPAP